MLPVAGEMAADGEAVTYNIGRLRTWSSPIVRFSILRTRKSMTGTPTGHMRTPVTLA
jgi:hypothetical protein